MFPAETKNVHIKVRAIPPPVLVLDLESHFFQDYGNFVGPVE